MASEAELRQHLRDVIALAQSVSQHGFRCDRVRQDPLGAVTYQMLIQAKRLAESIDRLGPQNAYEALLLARCILELWVNARWIRLREPKRRALRFLKFHAVEGSNLLNKVPSFLRDAEWKRKMRAWKRNRAQMARSVRPFLQTPSSSGSSSDPSAAPRHLPVTSALSGLAGPLRMAPLHSAPKGSA